MIDFIFITAASTRSILVYSDRQENINGVENKAEAADVTATAATPSPPISNKRDCYSSPTVEPVNVDQENKNTYHSFYVYPRSKGNLTNSPNLLWHELKIRGRSLSPSPRSERAKINFSSKSLTRESSMPSSSILVKKMNEEVKSSEDDIKPNFKIDGRPLISRDRVDRALETLRQSSVKASPKMPVRACAVATLKLSNTRLSRSESYNPTAKKESVENSGSQSMPPRPNPVEEMAEIQQKSKKILQNGHSETCKKNGDYKDTPQFQFSVVVAIDFGTTFSGYAYSFTHDPENIHIMRKWEGDDPGLSNQKTPTILLLSPTLQFHSFGFSARDFYHDLDQNEARRWYYFDKFKMILHHNKVIDLILICD